MNKYTLVGMSLAGGTLCGLAWTSWYPGLILLVALVPFFFIEQWLFENHLRFSKNSYFIYLLPGFMVFSILGIGWMRVASITGAICVITGLASLMALSLWAAHLIRIKAGDVPGFISMLTIWMTYELISLNVNIVSPWLNLGNGLAKDIRFIQWYDLTGTAGGTLWILASNLFLTIFIVKWISGGKKKLVFLLLWICVVTVPAAFSLYKFHTIKPGGNSSSEVVIVQPNIDPYTEKYVMPFNEQLRRAIEMAKSTATDKTEWIITPETTVDDPVNLDDLGRDSYIGMLKELTGKYPRISVVTGMISYRIYHDQPAPPTRSARKTDLSGDYYDHFNSAFRIDTGKKIEVYHKSKLVPGIEMQFAGGPGRLISRILPYLGGTKWGYGIQEERTCFAHSLTGMKIAPVICYESVFGSYVAEYVKNGAEAIFIITNDGWWKNTGGYIQHLNYASLRAIETRRPVARAANTGVSCLIDITGRRTQETGWWMAGTLRGEIIPETMVTPYVKYGDYLLKISALTSVIMVISIFIIIPVRKKIR